MAVHASRITWPEIQELINQGAIAFLPFGAMEQHGRHLPLATDTVMASGFAEMLAEEFRSFLLPAIPYGEAWNNTGFPGTFVVSELTVRAIAYDIGSALAAAGVPALIIVNGHHGNSAPLELAVRDLLGNLDFPVLLLNYPGLENAAREVCESKPAAPTFYHADEVETSIMLHLNPDLVQMDLAAEEYPEFPDMWGAFPIKLDTFCETGVFGDPRPATAEKGRQLLARLKSESTAVIKSFLSEIESKI